MSGNILTVMRELEMSDFGNNHNEATSEGMAEQISVFCHAGSVFERFHGL